MPIAHTLKSPLHQIDYQSIHPMIDEVMLAAEYGFAKGENNV
jgi:hypothetical protein